MAPLVFQQVGTELGWMPNLAVKYSCITVLENVTCTLKQIVLDLTTVPFIPNIIPDVCLYSQHNQVPVFVWEPKLFCIGNKMHRFLWFFILKCYWMLEFLILIFKFNLIDINYWPGKESDPLLELRLFHSFHGSRTGCIALVLCVLSYGNARPDGSIPRFKFLILAYPVYLSRASHFLQ